MPYTEARPSGGFEILLLILEMTDQTVISGHHLDHLDQRSNGIVPDDGPSSGTSSERHPGGLRASRAGLRESLLIFV